MHSRWPSGPPAIVRAAELSRAAALDDIEWFSSTDGDHNPSVTTPWPRRHHGPGDHRPWRDNQR
jgi:hypothetical protein